MIPTLSSLAAVEVGILKSYGATNDDKVGVLMIIGFQFCDAPIFVNLWYPCMQNKQICKHAIMCQKQVRIGLM